MPTPPARPRQATLTVRPTKIQLKELREGQNPHLVTLRAGNGEILMHSQSYFDYSNSLRGREAMIEAFKQVLRGDGYVVTLRPLGEKE